MADHAKPTFDWDPAWDTGNATIDQQHRQLLEQMERLFRAVAEGRKQGETERALMLLGEYVEIHFSQEEELMRQAGYPEFPRHKAIHDGLRLQVQALVKDFLEDLRPFPDAVMEFLVTWLKDHLAGEDRHLAAFLRSNAR